MQGVELVVSDSHDELRRAVERVMPTALWQRCAVHCLRNALAHAKRQTDPVCLEELKGMWAYRDVGQAREALRRWIHAWGEEPGREQLMTWVEEHIEETFSVVRLPRAHRKRLKSTNRLERFNEEIRRRTRVVRIVPNEAACVRLMRVSGRDPRSMGLGTYLSQRSHWPRASGKATTSGTQGGGMKVDQIRAARTPYREIAEKS